MSPFIVISLLKKIGYKEMHVQKLRNFVIAEFVKSGIHRIVIELSIHRVMSETKVHSGLNLHGIDALIS